MKSEEIYSCFIFNLDLFQTRLRRSAQQQSFECLPQRKILHLKKKTGSADFTFTTVSQSMFLELEYGC